MNSKINDLINVGLVKFLRKKVIYPIINNFLYLLLLSLSIIAFLELTQEIFHLFECGEIKTKNIFELVEHIYLYFLPILVVYSFIKWVTLDLERFLLYSKSDLIEDSMELIHSSKTLFVSTLLSYMFINTILELFENQDNVEIDYKKITFQIVLILVLSVYLLVDNNLKSKKSRKAQDNNEYFEKLKEIEN